jgi:acetyltransferase-like isoleucine patch superfamily enzyme
MLLSICIPSFNNAETLDKSISSIVSQEIFSRTRSIEVVVSDNASTDSTERVVKKYQNLTGDLVKYFKNDSNVGDKNFEIALTRGSGDFLKLANDSLLWQPNSLRNLLDVIQGAKDEKPQIIFTNANVKAAEFEIARSTDQVLDKASYYITWIGSFGVWKEDLILIKGFGENAALQLTQVEALFALVNRKKLALIDNRSFCSVLPPRQPKNYDVGKIFGTNYMAILRRPESKVSKATIQSERNRILLNHLLPLYFNDTHDFNRSSIRDELIEFQDEHQLESLISAHEQQHKVEVAKRTPSDWATVWRTRNSNNEITIANIFNFKRVTAGDHSYGPIRVLDWGSSDEHLTIGRFVSIASGVTFILGGNHPHSGVTTFPVKVKILGDPIEAQTKGPITIGNDVWIGTNATLLSGISVGQGAVIAAESVVVKNVPPYAIVAGNPAKIVKYRFSPDTIEKLNKIDYDKVLLEDLKHLGEQLYFSENTPEFIKCVQYLLEISGNFDGN